MDENNVDRRRVNNKSKEELTNEFIEAFNCIKESLKDHSSSISDGYEEYDRILVKQNLQKADLLLQNNGEYINGTTYYIALTTKMRGFIPVLSDDMEVYVDPYNHPFKLILDKVYLDKENLEYLSNGCLSDYFVFNEKGICNAKVSVKESVRKDGAQTHLGVGINAEYERPFTEFRKLLNLGDCLIGLKKKGVFEYSFFGLKKKDADALTTLNEKFYFNGNYETTNVFSSAFSYVEDGDNEEFKQHKFYKNSDQIIFYGVPGSGKSNMIEGILADKKISSSQKVRVVFHPDYSNVDFVGQVMPKKEGSGISYNFKEGPFTSILMKAYKNPEIPFYLIIEEINRGNASAIFGDVFQLLDRNSEGWSRYEITNEEVCKKVFGEDEAEKMEYKIKLPPNLSLLATMNTSDQNVFTLDNAFQRRWSMIHVKNEFQQNAESEVQRDSTINGTKLTWGRFLFGDKENLGINSIISKSSSISGMSSIEDKRLGCWFVVNRDGKITKEDFSNKVLKYLWDDAFHFDKSVFVEEIDSFDDLIEAFEKKQKIFTDLEIPYSDGNDDT